LYEVSRVEIEGRLSGFLASKDLGLGESGAGVQRMGKSLKVSRKFLLAVTQRF
jgi:hypothetical protein